MKMESRFPRITSLPLSCGKSKAEPQGRQTPLKKRSAFPNQLQKITLHLNPSLPIFDGRYQTERIARVANEHVSPRPIGSLSGKYVAGSATGAAQENPMQISAVAHGDSARRASVGSDVVFMKIYIGFPFDGVLRKYSPHMALRARRSTPLNAFKIGSVTGDIGTG